MLAIVTEGGLAAMSAEWNVDDVILNTADAHELRKDVLWDRAFPLLGDNLGYADSLLIEDGPKEPALFRARGTQV